jgi:hypothetical protein
MDMFLKGERWVLDYADRKPSMIWGTLFEIGQAIEVIPARTITQEEIEEQMGQDGPWGWGGFPTDWIESIAERIELPGGTAVLFEARKDASPNLVEASHVKVNAA